MTAAHSLQAEMALIWRNKETGEITGIDTPAGPIDPTEENAAKILRGEF